MNRTALLTPPPSPPLFRRLLLPLISGCLLLSISAGEASPAIGVNLTSDRLFADALRGARPAWDSATNFGDGSAPVDANGWPTTDASIMLWEGVGQNDGTYFVQFNGQATLSASFGYATFSNQAYNSSTNTTTATMTVSSSGSQNFSLVFKNTKRTSTSATNTGVTNVKVMRPITEGSTTTYPVTEMFTNQATNLVKKFQVVRFMDLTGTNGNTQTNWSDRVLPSVRRQSHLAWEYVVELCNESGRDAYINIPVKAVDDYITKLAQLCRYGSDGVNPYTSTQSSPVFAPLNSGLHIYIEFSNEVWNGSFQQFHDNLAATQGDIAAKNAEYSILNFDNLDTAGPDANGNYNNQYTLAWRRIAKRLVDTSNLWRSVFGDAAMLTSIRPVLEYQYANAQDTAHTELNFVESYYGNGDGKTHVTTPEPVSYYFWGAGGATYYGSNNNDATTIDGIFSAGIPSTGYASTMSGEAIWPKSYGLQCTAYEGGWSVEHSGGNGFSNPAGTPACESKYDPRAKQAEIDAQTIFNQNGGDLNIFYASSGAHTWIWGMTDNVFNLATPLFQAVDAINTSTQAVPTVGTVIPASNISTGHTGGFSGRWNFFINTASGGLFNVTGAFGGAVTVKISVDGRNMGTRTLAASGTTAPVTFGLNPGLHAVSFRNVGTVNPSFGTFTISSGAAGGAIQYETEDLTVAAKTSPTHRVFSDPSFSGGYGSILDATAVGDYVTYVVPNIPVATYNVRVGVKKTNTRGIWQLAIAKAGGTASNVGTPQDEYVAGTSFVELNLGNWAPGSISDKWFQFKITGKNAGSTGYSEAFDYIKLIPQ